MTADYQAFLSGKLARAVPTGIANVDPSKLSGRMFAFQSDVTAWSLRRGRSALFMDTGLGKSLCAIEWARRVAAHTRRPALILTPLAVAAQFVREGAKFGVDVQHVRSGADVITSDVVVTNYDRLHLFDASVFGGVVLDESSCLKDFTSATRNLLIETFAGTPFKLCCTATPSPNDFTELGNHAEFLGVMTRVEMLSTWFVHDGGSTQDWRLKGHAEADFWRWVSTWGLMVKRPSDLGYGDGGHILPPLVMHEHIVPGCVEDAWASGELFVTEAKTLQAQRAVKRATIDKRVAVAAALVAAEPDEPWIIWGELNAETDALEAAIPGAVQVAGADKPETKEARLLGFPAGEFKCLVSKTSIAGWGLNYQHCAHMAFVGVTHSFEAVYQGIRRAYRFGQARPVHVHFIIAEAEGPVLASLKRKQEDAERMAERTREHVLAHVREAVGASVREGVAYVPTVEMRVPQWLRGQS